MSKTKATQTSEEIIEKAQPTIYDNLLKNGTAVLTANTRDALAEIVYNIPADCKYAVGAVGFAPATGLFSIQVDIVK